MSSFSSYNGQDKSVTVLCSRRAEHTYEVTIATQAEPHDLKHSRSIANLLPVAEDRKFPSSSEPRWPPTRIHSLETPVPVAEERKFPSLRDLRWQPTRINRLESPVVSSPLQTPLSLQYLEEPGKRTKEKPRHVPAKPNFYFDPRRCQYRTSKQERCFLRDIRCPPAIPFKTVRQRLIEFVETDEFFDEYSFLALMTLLLAYMFRLISAVFAMGYSAHIMISVFVCVWRFIQIKVEDIFGATSCPQVGIKCTIFTVELIVIFVSIFFFFWAILIPVYNFFAGLITKVLYLLT